MRRGEIMQLTWNFVDPKRCVIVIPFEMTITGGGLENNEVREMIDEFRKMRETGKY